MKNCFNCFMLEKNSKKHQVGDGPLSRSGKTQRNCAHGGHQGTEHQQLQDCHQADGVRGEEDGDPDGMRNAILMKS